MQVGDKIKLSGHLNEREIVGEFVHNNNEFLIIANKTGDSLYEYDIVSKIYVQKFATILTKNTQK